MQSLWPMDEGNDVSADGSAVLGTIMVNGKHEVVLWQEGIGIRSLETILKQLYPEAAPWHVGQTVALSDDGTTVVGQLYKDDLVTTAAFLAVVPEPASIAYAFVGCCALVRVHRRCRGRRAM